MIELLEGDCRVVMEGLEAGSFATCITDPPYELGFMGKSWDRSGVAFDVEVWRWVLRLLKPGGDVARVRWDADVSSDGLRD